MRLPSAAVSRWGCPTGGAEGQVLELGDVALEPRRAPPGSIGAGVWLSGGQVVLVGVMPEGPAAQVGLRVGDVLLAVDGVPVKDPRGASQRLTGAPGSTVTVRVRRGGSEQSLTITRASGESVLSPGRGPG